MSNKRYSYDYLKTISTPGTNPPSGFMLIYPKTDGKLYTLDSSGNEVMVESVSNKSTDGTFSSESDILYPSEKAAKTYVDTAVINATLGLFDDRGNFDASGNLFPSSGGSGTAGAILKGDIWTVSVAGTLGGSAVNIGDTVRALTDSPGQTSTNWAIGENNIGYVPENTANKSVDGTFASNSDTLYASQRATKTYVDTAITTVNVPQTRIIYVDSTYGVDAVSRGSISKPYATIEYVLANTTNTGTFTGNTSNGTYTITSITDASYANLSVGQFITGTGIQLGTTVVSLDGGGTDAKQITVSKSATASNTGITLTWWTQYKIKATGVFTVASSLNKSGFIYDFKDATIYYGAIDLFRFTSNSVIPEYFFLGKTYGTSSSSRLFNHAITFQTFVLDYGYSFSKGTGRQIGNNNTFLNVYSAYVYGEMLDARFGYVANITYSETVFFSGKTYGLLGGVSVGRDGSTYRYATIEGFHETPSAITAVAGGNYGDIIVKAHVVGSLGLGYRSMFLGGNIAGSTIAAGDGCILNLGMYASGAITVSGFVTITGQRHSDYGGNSTLTVNAASKLSLNGGLSFSTITNNGTIYNNSQMDCANTGTFYQNGTLVNNGSIVGSFGGAAFQIGANSTFENYGLFSGTVGFITTGTGWKIFNGGKMKAGNYGIRLEHTGTFENRGTIENNGAVGNVNALIYLNSATATFLNYGVITNTNNTSTEALIRKIAGVLKLYPGSRLITSNSKGPLTIPTLDSGTTTATTANKLVQSGQNFATTVLVGALVVNTTDSTTARVTAVDSNTQLSLDADIMTSGENFTIYGDERIYLFDCITNSDGSTYGTLIAWDGSSHAANDLVGGTLRENTNY